MEQNQVKDLIQKLNYKNNGNLFFKDFLDLNTKDEIINRYNSLLDKKYLDQKTVESYLNQLKKKYNVRAYTPYKYFEGLTNKQQVKSRFLDIVKGKSSDASKSDSYKPFQTDLNKKQKKKSKYTIAFENVYGDAKTLEQKSKVSGIPLNILDEVFRKGKAAWRTGHRVGATEDQWGYARVHSFIMLGCTAFGSDFYLLKKAIERMNRNDVKKWFSLTILCPENTLKKKYYEKFHAKQFIKNYFN